MGNPSVVDPVLSPGWLKKRKNIFAELDRQLILGIENPGTGLNLDQLQLVTEHKNAFAVTKKKALSRFARLKILQFISRYKVVDNKKFVAADNFKIGNAVGVKFWGFGSNFENHFLQKVENNVPAGFIKSYRLKQDSVDKPIQEELGECQETFLSDFFEQLKKQATGQSGRLAVDGSANIFYIRDVNGKVWAVSAYWIGAFSGWHVFAGSVGYACPWFAGSLVFAR